MLGHWNAETLTHKKTKIRIVCNTKRMFENEDRLIWVQFIIVSYKANNNNIPTKMQIKTKATFYVEWWKHTKLQKKSKKSSKKDPNSWKIIMKEFSFSKTVQILPNY